MTLRSLLLSSALLVAAHGLKAQNKIWSYGIGNWRNGPVVVFTPVFETTEKFTTLELIKRIRHDYAPDFTDTTDIDVLRFATPEEANESHATVAAKYTRRQLQVVLLDEPTRVPQAPADERRK